MNASRPRKGRPTNMPPPWNLLMERVGSVKLLAAAFDVAPSTLHRWAKGEMTMGGPARKMLETLCKEHNVPFNPCRGLVGFRLDGRFFGFQNPRNSQPDSLGREVVEFVASLKSPEALRIRVAALEKMPLKPMNNPEGWRGREWLESIRVGEVQDAAGFTQILKFCDYAYVLDLDTYTLEFWKGESDGYLPCAHLKSVAFSEADLKALNLAYGLKKRAAVKPKREKSMWTNMQLNHSQKLLTKELLKAIPNLYSTEDVPLAEKHVMAHFFSAAYDLWVVEFDPQDGLFFGYARFAHMPEFAEWGFVDAREMCETSNKLAPKLLQIERDVYWTPKPAKAIPEIRS